MQNAYKTCMERVENEEKYESWENLLVKNRDSFLQVLIQKYVQNLIPERKVADVFRGHWKMFRGMTTALSPYAWIST